MFKPGDIVISRAGHDTDRIYVVIRAEDEFSYVSDGEYRKLDMLKKKRNKHLRFLFGGEVKVNNLDAKDEKQQELANNFSLFSEKLQKATDADIKRIIKQWRAYAERR